MTEEESFYVDDTAAIEHNSPVGARTRVNVVRRYHDRSPPRGQLPKRGRELLATASNAEYLEQLARPTDRSIARLAEDVDRRERYVVHCVHVHKPVVELDDNAYGAM